jgi:hypothetical protein
LGLAPPRDRDDDVLGHPEVRASVVTNDPPTGADVASGVVEGQAAVRR